jgi:hypothetical protein
LAQPGFGQQRIGEHIFPALGTAGQELRHQGVAIAIHNQAGQAIGITMNEAKAVTFYVKSASCAYGTCASSYKKRSINALIFIKTPDPGADFGARTEGGPSQKLAVMRLHPHGFARVATALGNGRLKNPGMAAQERALFFCS